MDSTRGNRASALLTKPSGAKQKQRKQSRPTRGQTEARELEDLSARSSNNRTRAAHDLAARRFDRFLGIDNGASESDSFTNRWPGPLTIVSLKAEDITKDMIGRFADYLLVYEDLACSTSLDCMSSVRVLLERKTCTRLFDDNKSWYSQLRKSLEKEFYNRLPEGVRLVVNRAPLMTPEDLRLIGGGLFADNTTLSLKDRTLINFQWAVVGRISDITNLEFCDLL